MKKGLIVLFVMAALIVSSSIAQADYKTVNVHDTSFDGWVSGDAIVNDAHGDAGTGIDWYDVFAANDNTNLYLSYTTASSIVTGEFWKYSAYLSTNLTPGTGYGWMGAEYMLQGTSVFQYTGTGENWSWGAPVAVPNYVSGNQVESEISRALLGSPAAFDAKLLGDDVGQDWAICTTYSMSGAPAPVPEPSSLLLLGSGIVGLAAFIRKK